jgi:pimeloyl-ACP methyl ester carboxylesterase
MQNPLRVLSYLTVFAAALAAQQQKQPPARYIATEADKQQISAKMAELGAQLPKLERNPLYADVAIYHKAADFILKHPEEFATAAFVRDTLAALDTGLARARELSAGSPQWVKSKGRVLRGFVSTIDGSVQPYSLSIPESYTGQQPMRLDIWMHGTDRNLNEVSFITRQRNGAAPPADQKYIQMDVYGRSNVSYRWAGETDVFEAIRHAKEHYKIDPDRITARGHSMGGAGAWHLGLHHPDEWSAFEASAGYTETMVYAKKEPLPPYQKAALHYYDAVDYSLNGVNVPFVGYGGELDAQLQASKNIQAQLLKEGLDLTAMRALFLIGPQTGHAWHPETHKVSERFVDEAVAKGRPAPARIRFVTYTTRFNRCYWVTLEELGKHYERAEVDANREGNRTTVTTKNVTRIKVDGPGAISLDGQDFPATGVFARANGKWTKAGTADGLRKRHGLQGPVDDAFMESFLCVRPTGTGTKATEYGMATLGTLQHDFSKWLRGEPRVKNDRDVTTADIANNNLILFGDPWSNSVIAKVIGKLPIRWTREKITLAGKTVDASAHAPAMIYPNPLNPNRYVVINSGHTFSDSDWRGTNANLYPHIGDYALMSLTGEIAHSGFFDERWK